MGFIAHGRKVAESGDEVRYAVGVAPADVDAPGAGVVVIPVADPEGWSVVGGDTDDPVARRILGKAVRAWRETGAWPERVAYYS